MGIQKSNIAYCFDGMEALTMLINSTKSEKTVNFSLVIIDYHIPTLDGLDVIKKARDRFKNDGFTFPTVVMLTAVDDERLRNASLRQNNVDFFFNKPAPIDQLEQVIKSAMKKES
jgi:CheY-like chemotaxis protein